MRIGQAIKTVRTQRGFSQEYLASLSNVTGSYISQIEGGHKTDPGIQTLQRISYGLEMPLMLLVFLAKENDLVEFDSNLVHQLSLALLDYLEQSEPDNEPGETQTDT